MLARLAALSCLAALAACGPSIRDLDDADDAATTSGSASSASSDPSATSDSSTPFDVPPPELSCEDQHGHFTLLGGPWTLVPQTSYHSPGYALLPDDEGLLAIWRGESIGTDPMPNFLGARASFDGELLSEVAPIWERPVLIEPSVHRAEEGFLVTFCGRFGYEDELAAQLLDAQGQPLATETLRDPQSHCGAARPEGVWTGQRYLFAWIDNSSMEVLLDVADPTLASLGVTTLAQDGDLSAPPRMAVGPESVLLVVGLRDDQVLALSLAHDGTLLDSYPLAVPPDHDVGGLAVGAHPDGSFSVYLAERSDPGLFHSRIDSEGQSPPALVEATARFDDPLLVHRPGGLLLVSTAYTDETPERIWIIATDDTGTPTSIETLPTAPGAYYEAAPAVAVHEGDAYVLYTSAYESETYDVRLARLGCAR
jgi:hypothetical protein